MKFIQHLLHILLHQILWPARYNWMLALCWVAAMRVTTGRLPMLAGLIDDLSALCLLVILLTTLHRLPKALTTFCMWALVFALGAFIISNDLYFAFYRGYLSPAALAHTGDAGRAAPSALMLLSWPVVALGLLATIAILIGRHRQPPPRLSLKIQLPVWLVGLAFCMLVFSFRNPIYMHAKENPLMYLLRASQNELSNQLEDANLTAQELKWLKTFRPQKNNYQYENDDFPLLATPSSTQKPSPTMQRNVIMVVMESVPAVEMGLYGNQESATPQLDAIAQESFWASTFYANGNQTVRGELALLCSMLDRLKSAPVVTINPDLRATCLPRLLKEQGYRTHWFHGNTSSFFRRAPFFLRHGFEKLHDGELLKKQEPPLNEVGWGISDPDVFDYALNILEKEQQPFFAEVMTLSNHHPFTWDWGIPIPERLNPGADDVETLFRHGIYYTDHAIGQFWKRFSASKLSENTLVVFVGDHGLWLYDQATSQLEEIGQWERYFRLPLIMAGPGISPQRFTTPASQVDVPATILDWLGYDVPHAFLGQSLFKPVPAVRPIWMHHEADFNFRYGDDRCYTPMSECGNDRYLRCTRYADAISPHTCFSFQGDLLRQKPSPDALGQADSQTITKALLGSRALQKLVKHQQIRPTSAKDFSQPR